MDTIYEESSINNELEAKKRSKEIEVIEVEWENEIYAENDRVVRKYFQVIFKQIKFNFRAYDFANNS